MAVRRFAVLNGPFVDTIIETEISDPEKIIQSFFPNNKIVEETFATGPASPGLVYNEEVFAETS